MRAETECCLQCESVITFFYRSGDSVSFRVSTFKPQACKFTLPECQIWRDRPFTVLIISWKLWVVKSQSGKKSASKLIFTKCIKSKAIDILNAFDRPCSIKTAGLPLACKEFCLPYKWLIKFLCIFIKLGRIEMEANNPFVAVNGIAETCIFLWFSG